MAVTLQKYKETRIKQIEDLINAAGLMSYDITEAVKEGVEQAPELKDYLEKMVTWRDIIQEAKDMDWVDKMYEGAFQLIKNLMKRKNDEKIAKINEDAQWWKDHYQKQNEWWKKYNAGEFDWQKDTQKKAQKEAENNQKLNDEMEDSSSKFDQKAKRDDIKDVEWELKRQKVSEEKLNQRLGVSDWREEINTTSGWSQSLSRRFDLIRMIEEISREFTCAKCGQAKSSYFPYEKRGKKYCSYECQRDDGKIEMTDIGKIVKAFQDWMKQNQIEKISYSTKGELVIQFVGQTAKEVEDSQLSPKQKEIKSFLKANPQTSEISTKEEYAPYSPNKKSRNPISSQEILVGLVIVGAVAIIIALIVRATGRNKD